MSRLEVPVTDRTLFATGDVVLRIDLKVEIRTSFGSWKPETFLVDSGTEITTFPAWLARQEGYPMPQASTRGVSHVQTGQEVRSGVLRLRVVGMGPTEYVVPCFFLGDPQVQPMAQATPAALPRKLLQPLHLLGHLRFELAKEPAGWPYGRMVVETV